VATGEVLDASPLGASRMRLFRAGRPLKRWRYVGVFCEEIVACAALIQVGPVRQSFWAVCSRADGRLRERTSLLQRGGTVVLDPGRLRVRDRDVLLDLSLEEGAAIEARCTHGRGQVWTRKQVGVPARGTIALDGEPPREIEALAAIDDTAGYHARHTEWWWSAGVGERPDGAPLAWNLVAGVNDPPTGSERAVWVDGAPHEVSPVSFASDLSLIRCPADGSELRFAPEAERRRHENLLIVSSDYRAPFGTFSGTLPGKIPLAHGLGVTEHHRARW
jgi:hypothetical protein